MVYRRFSVLLAVRLIVLGVAIAAALWLMLQPGLHSATLLALGFVAAMAAELWWFIRRTNREVARFLDAARHADYSQRFGYENLGTGFGELAAAFTDILNRMYEQRSNLETDLRRLRALIDHIPIPLMTLHGDGSITLQNNAARRLFGAAHVTQIADLRQFGTTFHDAVAEAVPGQRELVTFEVEGIDYKLTLATSENIVAGESSRLLSLQDIQSELNITQAEAWQDLVRVLTHEIMNSITPVTSLAATASDVVDDIVRKAGHDEALGEDLQDLRDAVHTVARRSDSLMQFVNSYRQITHLAPPEKKRVHVGDLFESVRLLAEAEWPGCDETFSVKVEPAELDVYADRDLLEPVVMNLLRNAFQATAGINAPHIELRGRLNRRGNVVIEVRDNGPGIPDDIARKIFVPFFTTKKEGSGVGLALARQVMTAHGGFVRLAESDGGGAAFTLTF
ncbi:MAG: PAS domain-containing protein [Gammaproteobacteria bacterium]|nr:PAS domain-containing protein [Gammaproteobacteria bacterium]